MSAQPKYSYAQVKNQFEAIREIAREAAIEGLPVLLTNSRGMAISKETVTLSGMDLQVEAALKRWEQAGARRVAWDWGRSEVSIDLTPSALSFRFGIETIR